LNKISGNIAIQYLSKLKIGRSKSSKSAKVIYSHKFEWEVYLTATSHNRDNNDHLSRSSEAGSGSHVHPAYLIRFPHLVLAPGLPQASIPFPSPSRHTFYEDGQQLVSWTNTSMYAELLEIQLKSQTCELVAAIIDRFSSTKRAAVGMDVRNVS
jgi:hypothetical protein